jgi:catalase
MPNSSLSQDLLGAITDLNGVHPGFRPVHSKGVFLAGTFTPAAAARSLTRAPHIQNASTAVTVRFSDGAGFPNVADNDPNNAGPRGLAVRFHLGQHIHTDIIGHSVDGFPARTPEEFLEFLRAAHAGAPIQAFLAAHPAALAFVQAPKPIPSSFARESYFTVTAFKFTAADGSTRFGRFRVRPEGGNDYLDASAAAAKSANFLMDEIAERVLKGPVKLRIVVQLAESGDTVDDATAHWPEDRPESDFGTIALTAVAPDDDEHRRIIFDPIPRVDGIDSSGDPLLEARAAVYLMSGRRRREAAATA